MVSVPAGSFVMGQDHSAHIDETPAHRVTLTGFYMDETLVTVAAFRQFVEQTGHITSAERLGYGMVSREGMDDWQWDKVEGATWRHPWGSREPVHTQADDEPVVMVSWYDAVAYCEKLRKRLPTEAEWEYAMRAGQAGTRFPWGDEPTLPDGSMGLNFWQGSSHQKNDRVDGYVYTSPVRAFPPNAWGLYDVAGNAWQWTADWYSAETYKNDAAGVVDPKGAEKGWARVARGGSWWCSANACSAYGTVARGKSRPRAPYNNNSFRCVQTMPPR